MNRRNGFTVLELLIVVALIGILAATAIPNFRRVLIKARMLEAQTMLKVLYEDEVAYNRDTGTFWPKLRKKGKRRRQDYGGTIKPYPLPGTGKTYRGLNYLYRIYHFRNPDSVRIYAIANKRMNKSRYDVDGDRYPDAWVKVGGGSPIHYRNDLDNSRIKVKF